MKWPPRSCTSCHSLPPRGAAGRLGAARRRPGLLAPTLPHFVWSLPPRGAAGRLGAARRRPDSFVVGLLDPQEGLSAHRFVSLAAPSLRVAPAWRGARRQQRKTPCESLALWLNTRLTACAHS